MSVKPTGSAITTAGGLINPVVVGGGYQSDSDDTTYVESVERKATASSVASTFRYLWDFDPDPDLPPGARVHARVTLIDATFSDAFDAGWAVFIARASDGLVLTGIGSLIRGGAIFGTLEVGVPTWVVLSGGPDADALTALKTGTYPGYGPARLSAGWSAQPGFPAGAIGDEARIRLHEFYIGPTAPAPLRLYPRSQTRLYPRRRTRRPGTF